MNSKEQTVRDIYAFVAGSDLDPHCMEEAIEILDQHAAEARAEQREVCARKSKKVIDEYFRTSGHNKMMQGRIENACLNAVEKSE